jgi:hypothetical protein
MKFVCLKCGHEERRWAERAIYKYRLDSSRRYWTCNNCGIRQPSRPIEAAIWVFRGMPKVKA